jgi:hypothetical protein
MRDIRAMTATIVAVCISFCVGSLSAKPIETRVVPDRRAAASARAIESFVPGELVAAFGIRFRSTTLGLELELET